MSISSSAVARVDYLVIGSGVVGLAISRALSLKSINNSIITIDKNHTFGLETSSRNSQVIHAGLYYPPNSLKTRLCIKGRELLYTYLKERKINFRKTGKWIVATDLDQVSSLEKIYKHAKQLQVPIDKISANVAKSIEPQVYAVDHVLVSPETGILDVYQFMASLESDFKNNGGDAVYNQKCIGIEKNSGGNGYRVTIQDTTSNEIYDIDTNVLINAAGLYATQISDLVTKQKTDVYYCKGHYFSLMRSKGLVNRLIYPVPDPLVTSLGFHLTLSLDGTIKFGPDTYFQDNATDYDFRKDTAVHLDQVHDYVKRYMPFVRKDDLYPDYTGIRPKLVPPGSRAADFKITLSPAKDFIDLVGIESPGVTSSLAIAEYVVSRL